MTESITTQERISQLEKAIRDAKDQVKALENRAQTRRQELGGILNADEWRSATEEISQAEAEIAVTNNRILVLGTQLAEAQRDLQLERLQAKRQEMLAEVERYKTLEKLAIEAYQSYAPALYAMYQIAEGWNYQLKQYGQLREQAGIEQGADDFDTPYLGAPDTMTPPAYERIPPGLPVFQRNWEIEKAGE